MGVYFDSARKEGQMATSKKQKRILVAVDGSEQAFEAVRYVSRAVSPGMAQVVLFHVVTRVPESFLDMDKEPAYRYRIVNIGAWEQQQEKLTRDFMERSREVFVAAGFPEGAVSILTRNRKVGIARDIASEALDSYDAIVLGRSGLSDLKDFVLGSIAQKVIEKVSNVPIWVIGGNAGPKRMLIGMDVSDGAMLAVRHVAEMLGGTFQCDVTMFHAIRSVTLFQRLYGGMALKDDDPTLQDRVREELEQVRKAMEPRFTEARRCLLAAGAPAERIRDKIVTGAASRAVAIMEEAEREGCDTIVVGRRGLSRVQEFFMGRISNKVIQLAKDRTVWVVS